MITLSKELEEQIKSLLEEEKSDDEIVAFLQGNEETKSFDVAEIAEAIYEAKKSVEIKAELRKKQAELDAEKAAKRAEKKADEKVSKIVDEKLKSINIDPFRKFETPRELKVFDHKTGEIKSVYKPSEIRGQFNNMLKCLALRDSHNAKAIEQEIAQDNAKYMADLAGQKATPSVSDVDARGGYSIPIEVEMEIQQLTYSSSSMLPIVNQDSGIVYEQKIYPVMYGLEVAYIADQSTALTEKNPAYTNPAINMERVGAYSAISNTFLRQKGVDLTNAMVAAYGSEYAKFFDLHIACGSVDGNSDLIDGICFDANATKPTAIPYASGISDIVLADIKNQLDSSVDFSRVKWVANRKVSDKIGLLENGAGNKEFPGYLQGGNIRPFGYDHIINPQIPSTLDIGGDARTGGTDDVLICADFSKVIVGMTPTLIDFSEHFLFTSDAVVMRGVKSWGQKVIMGSGDAGVVAVVQELTNA